MPVLQIDQRARILIAGQAPGRRVHETRVPFDDPSGDRLREWMGIDKDTFYNPEKIGILPIREMLITNKFLRNFQRILSDTNLANF